MPLGTWLIGWVVAYMDVLRKGGWMDGCVSRASQLLTSNLKECKSVVCSLKQELQKVHKAPETACENLNV